MKKIISVLLCVMLLFSLFAVHVFAATVNFNFNNGSNIVHTNEADASNSVPVMHFKNENGVQYPFVGWLGTDGKYYTNAEIEADYADGIPSITYYIAIFSDYVILDPVNGNTQAPKPTVKKELILRNDSKALSVAGISAQNLLVNAGEGASLYAADGTVLNGESKVGTGAILVLADSTQYTVCISGDIDGDGAINAEDARSILRTAVQLDSLTEVQGLAADVDLNDDITSSDARRALRASVCLEDPAEWLTVSAE